MINHAPARAKKQNKEKYDTIDRIKQIDIKNVSKEVLPFQQYQKIKNYYEKHKKNHEKEGA